MSLQRHYATTLPSRFTAPLAPRTPTAPKLVALNEPLARMLGLNPDWLRGPEGIALLGGGLRPDGEASVAMAYSGHQFGHFNPTLGDGRAMLVGEATDAAGRLFDIHLKGSGPTPFSRRGDGRAALGPVLREYVVSEAMAALGIPTTRALAALTTGDVVLREIALPGAVIARVALSHIRVGTFEYAAATGEKESIRALADYAIDRLYPALRTEEAPYLGLLRAVMERQARLVAQWMLVGFVHGVMNTDNTSIAGETIDFGPCAFLDEYDPGKVFSSIDEYGRYAFGRQADITLWNLARLAEAILPLLDADPQVAVQKALGVLEGFDAVFGRAHLSGWREKLGLTVPIEGDAALITRFLDAMHKARADFTLACRRLGDAAGSGDFEPFLALFDGDEVIRAWVSDWQARLAREDVSPAERHQAMQRVNPRVIPRNHRIEAMIDAAVRGDYAPFEMMMQVLARPFDDGMDGLDAAPVDAERVRATYCGT
jgi:serine/tyrosine/threonine adenylyltransferase